MENQQSKDQITNDQLKASIDTIMDYFYDPVLAGQNEINSLQYQQRDTLYRMRVSNRFLLNKNESYQDKIKADLTGASRADVGIELTIERVHKARTALQRAMTQHAYIEGMEEALATVWNERFPDDKFKMPVVRKQRATSTIPSDATLEGELAALKALGVDVTVAETHSNDERSELEGASER
jgi:hypothetical protein